MSDFCIFNLTWVLLVFLDIGHLFISRTLVDSNIKNSKICLSIMVVKNVQKATSLQDFFFLGGGAGPENLLKATSFFEKGIFCHKYSSF